MCHGIRECRAKSLSPYITCDEFTRYVDNTCYILKRGIVDGLLHHLNNMRPTIKFTVEVEDGGPLPFLDNVVALIIPMVKNNC